MNVHHHNEKAQRYIALLDAARTAGNWSEIPELIRKVGKHAPERKRLLQVAKAELDIIKYATALTRRPGTSDSTNALPDSLIASLESDIQSRKEPDEESLQAEASILWARWIGARQKSTTIPPLSFDPARAAADASSTWTKVCVVKTVYIQGMFLSQAGRTKESASVNQILLPWLDSNRSLVVSTPQLLYWAQQLLGRVALASKQYSSPADIEFDETSSFRLQAFRHWAVLAVKNKPVSASTYGNSSGHLSNLAMWRAYYRFVSAIVHQRPGVQHISIDRADLSLELRRVETSYESELLRNAQFPKATESNKPVEDWVEEVISNWQILCGASWVESDLGEGGRNSVGRNVLEILYRAATKTFHSTLILRRLFQVHKALADFDLAYKALETYIEIVDKGRAQAAKTSEPAAKQDSDRLYLQTIAEGVEALCSYGRQVEAEKAYDLCLKLEDLLDEIELPSPSSTPNGVAPVNGQVYGNQPLRGPLSPEFIDEVYRAIGIGKSHWARWTPFSETRSLLQSEAQEALEKAARQDLQPDQHVRTLFALARLFAETREIDQAIGVVKRALGSEIQEQDTAPSYQNQRNLIPFWHLLSLLLTSRQDFETAGQSCAAAFEQFVPSDVIFGIPSDGANGAEKTTSGSRSVGLVDHMECDELQRMIEIRVTELALTELTEGHEHAVNSSNDLLGLYSRLFGRLGGTTVPENTSRTKLALPPKGSAATIKSSRGSLFSRKKVGRSSESYKGLKTINAPSIAEETTRPNTQATQAPTIHVTNEDEKPSPQRHRLFRTSHEHTRDEKQTASGVPQKSHHRRRLSRSASRGRKTDEASHRSSDAHSYETTPETILDSGPMAKAEPPGLTTIASQEIPAIPPGEGHDSSDGAKQPLNLVPHNLGAHDKVPPPTKHDSQPPEQDVRLPIGGPSTAVASLAPRFPKAAAQKQALSILVKIWLVIATLYRRSKMFEDSREACDEAAKVALRIEGVVASIESSARAFREPGWGGGGKSSDELWADVYCERGELLMAIAREREEKDSAAISDGIRDAVEQYEQCLMYFGNHAGGIVGLSNVLLDYYERKVELAKRVDGGSVSGSESVGAGRNNFNNPNVEDPFEDKHRKLHRRDASRTSDDLAPNGALSINTRARGNNNSTPTTPAATNEAPTTIAAAAAAAAAAAIGITSATRSAVKDEDLKKTPDNLNRLAARDRAYGLLSTLTKLGAGWDNSEAWLALARAHELGGELDKARQILWWCVELEDTRPIRSWDCIGGGGYVL